MSAQPVRSVLGALMVLASVAFAPAVGAQEAPAGEVVTEYLTARIVSDVSAIAPGETLRIGVEYETAPKWHVYWKNPGDTGIPTSLTFEAPDAFAFHDIQWPAPTRFVDKIGGVSYAYEGKVILYSEVAAPADLLEGSSVTLTAKTRWLVCHENCVNGSATLSLTLPVQAAPLEERRSAAFARFEAAAAAAPAEPPSDLLISHELTGDADGGVSPGEDFTIIVRVTDARGRALAPPEDVQDAFMADPAKGLRVARVGRAENVAGLAEGSLALAIAGEASKTATQLGATIDGVLRLRIDGEPKVYDVRLSVPRSSAPVADAATPEGADAAPALVTTPLHAAGEDVCAGVPAFTGGGSEESRLSSLLLAFLFAFVGGILLNAMPCVLPVLSLKALSIVEHSGLDRGQIRKHGYAYTAGVMGSFLVLGILGLVLAVGNWGFQLQSPVFIAVFVAILFAFALSLFGVFEISLPGVSRIDQKVAASEGYASSFNYGIFAVLLGTPCTAPFLGPAMTYAFTQPPVVMLALLLTVGAGLAFPFLMLALFPQWKRFLPKPGPWLTTFKKAMGFLLVGTAVFFLNTFAAQVTRGALVGYLIFLTLLALALWIYGHWGSNPIRGGRTRLIGSAVTLALIVFGAMELVDTAPPPAPPATIAAGGLMWHDFDGVDVRAEARAGRTVFIDFTAEWCSTCKVNEASAIHVESVRAAFEQLGVMAVKADFTREKPEIAKWLREYNEPSVPLYVVIPAGDPDGGMKLPTFPLSEGDVLSAVCTAGPSRTGTQAAL